MNYNLEIQKILLDVDKLSEFDDKIVLLKQAIQLADANNDKDWGFDLRLNLIDYEGLTAHFQESFPAFAWILNTCDTDPELFEDKEVLEKYKWMIHASFDYLGISREQIKKILDDYLQRLINNGYSRRSYYDLEVSWSLFTGDVQRAREYLQYRDTEPVDAMTPGSEAITDICVESLDGNFDKAITIANEFVAQKPDEKGPAHCILVYYLGLAKDERASLYFEQAEDQLSKVNKYPYMLFDISQLMYYLTKRDKEKAWAYFEKYAHWQIGANDYYQFDYSLALLPLLEGDGTKALSLNPKFPYYQESGIYNIKDLYEYYSEKVNTLSLKFDERNGNDYFQRQVKRHLSY